MASINQLMSTSTTARTIGSLSQLSPTSNMLTTFPQFRKLPIELRLKIWEEATGNNPRVVEISFLYPEMAYKPRYMWIFNHEIVSYTLVPAMLHVNSEARNVGLKVYKQCALSRFLGGRNCTYINFATDTVLAGDKNLATAVIKHPFLRDNMEKLAIGTSVARCRSLGPSDFQTLAKIKEIHAVEYKGMDLSVWANDPTGPIELVKNVSTPLHGYNEMGLWRKTVLLNLEARNILAMRRCRKHQLKSVAKRRSEYKLKLERRRS